MARITDLQAQLKKEQVEQFKLKEKLMERDSLILKLESHRQTAKFEKQRNRNGQAAAKTLGPEEIMKALGMEKEADIEHGLKKLRKSQKFCS